MSAIEPLAQEGQTLYSSPAPQAIFPGSPGIWRMECGRLVVTYDLRGPGVQPDCGDVYQRSNGACTGGHVLTSDDRGKTWQPRARFPFQHARPFEAGGALYVLGQADDLCVIRSMDGGDNWDPPTVLTNGECWHQAPANVWFANHCVYLVMEKRLRFEVKGWPVSEFAPVLMRGAIGENLTKPDAWTYASELAFTEAVPDAELNYFGVPFYSGLYPEAYRTDTPGRGFAPAGWLETNVVQFRDPEQYGYDPSGRTFHLFARAHTGRTNLACMAKVVQEEDGTMRTMLERAPSGKIMAYVPWPGGQMKFHILYDDQTALYWLVSTQTTDSMCRWECLPPTRYRMADNERRRLVLHFSRNCMDWCFAGLVCQGSLDVESRHYASMAIDGEDLLILSRSGDDRARNPHDVNLITLHRVRNFRSLVY